MGYIEIARADITEEAVDAVVNAANAGLYAGGGVCKAIHKIGGATLTEECLAYPGGIVHADTRITLTPDQARIIIHGITGDRKLAKRKKHPEDMAALTALIGKPETGEYESADVAGLAPAIDALGDGLAFGKRRFYTRCALPLPEICRLATAFMR
jgi:hypothetical protein